MNYNDAVDIVVQAARRSVQKDRPEIAEAIEVIETVRGGNVPNTSSAYVERLIDNAEHLFNAARCEVDPAKKSRAAVAAHMAIHQARAALIELDHIPHDLKERLLGTTRRLLKELFDVTDAELDSELEQRFII